MRPLMEDIIAIGLERLASQFKKDLEVVPLVAIHTSKPYSTVAASAAGATFNVSVNFSRPVIHKTAAGLSAVTLSAKLRTTTSYGSYTQPKPHPAAGLSAVTLSAKLRTTTSYGSYTQPAPHPASGLSAVTLSAKLKRVIVEAPTPPEAVGATFNVGVTFDR